MSEPAAVVGAVALRALTDDTETLAAALEDLDHDTLRLKDTDDLDALLVLLQQLDARLADLKRIRGNVQDRAWTVRGDAWGDYHHPDLGVVSIRRTADRPRWDHETTARRVIEQHMAEVGGEVTDPDVIAGWVLEAGAVSYWRKGVLKGLGVDWKDEDLFWSEPGNPTITFPSAPRE